MPRNVRNFWIELDVDGRKEKVATGPVRKDGGFSATIYMRDKGEVVRTLAIEGHSRSDGTLYLWASVPRDVSADLDGPIEIYTER